MTLVFADRIPEVLEDYWLGPKGSARVGGWGNPGSYRACLRELRSEGVEERFLHGECANLYHKATGKWPGRPKEHGLTAAVETHTGAMIALIPTDADAERLAVKGDAMPTERGEKMRITVRLESYNGFYFVGSAMQPVEPGVVVVSEALTMAP